MKSLLLVLVTAQLATSMPTPLEADVVWIAEDGFCEPETVLPLPDDTLLVSNVCDYRTKSDGYLTLLDADGRTINPRQVDGLDSPLGMTLFNDRLYVVDNNAVKVFDWPSYDHKVTGALLTSVANDIAVAGNGNIYVTDTARGEVAVLSPTFEQSLLIDAGRFPGANGIHVDGDIVYVGGEKLWRVDLSDSSVAVVGPEWLTDIDGIEMEADGTLQVTPVGGPLVRLGDQVEVLGGDGISSANHGYAANLGLGLIPTGFDNTVIAIRVDDAEPPAEDHSSAIIPDE